MRGEATRARDLGLVGLLMLALLWPALINQRPAYFFDSVVYLNTGNQGLALVERKLTSVAARTFGATGKVQGPASPPPAVREIVTIRSIAYTLFIAATSAPRGQLFAAIVIHALLVAGLIALLFRTLAPRAAAGELAVATAAIAVLTSAPWFVSYAMPDVLAGALILVVGLLTVAPDATPLWRRLLLVTIGAFAVATHASHVPLGAALVVAALCGLALRDRDAAAASRWRTAAWVAAPLGLGVAATFVLSLAGVGEASVAPKRLPFTLARSIEDGPARWYLERNCAAEKYVICRFFTRFPQRQTDILFGRRGINGRATAAEMDAMRAEEVVILRRTLAAYPFAQAGTAARNFGRQLAAFGLRDTSFRWEIVRMPNGKFALSEASSRIELRRPFTLLIYIGVGLAIIYLLATTRRWTRTEAMLAGLAAVGLIANAAITGVLSAVADRYQSRVVWVLPVLAIAFWLTRRSRARSITTAKVTLA